MGLRQREQASLCAAQRFQWGNCLRKFLDHLFRCIEVSSQHEPTRVVAVKLVLRFPESHQRVGEAGRSSAWARTAQHCTLQCDNRARVDPCFRTKT